MFTVNTCLESKWFSVDSSVPQSSVLRPLLFILYVNDIPDLVNSKIKMFADDIKIYTVEPWLSDPRLSVTSIIRNRIWLIIKIEKIEIL